MGRGQRAQRRLQALQRLRGAGRAHRRRRVLRRRGHDEVEGPGPIKLAFVGGMLWDGRATGANLGNPAADQALGPFLVDPEQNMPSKQAVCDVVAASRYANLFEEVWGPGSLDCSEAGVDAMFDRVGLSIAAYEASHEVSPFDSVYDDYWRACLDSGNDPEDCGKAEGDKAELDPLNILTDQEFDGLIENGPKLLDLGLATI